VEEQKEDKQASCQVIGLDDFISWQRNEWQRGINLFNRGFRGSEIAMSSSNPD